MKKSIKKEANENSTIWIGDFSELIKEAIDYKEQTQVNGFDLTVKEIFSYKGEGAIDFDNSKRVLPEYIPLKLINNEYWSLNPGYYAIRYNEVVTVPLNAIGIIQPRSTLLRMGGAIIGAWWDSGYSGRGQGMLIVGHPLKLYKSARIAQIIFILSKKVEQGYKGKYQNEAK